MHTHFPFVRAIILVPLVWMTSFTLKAQVTQFSPGYTWRQYSGCNPNRLCHFYQMTNPTLESKYQEFAAWRNSSGPPNPNAASSFLNFRVAFPLNYDANREEPYPIILFLHGGGEAGRIGNCCGVNWGPDDPRVDNNSHQLLHGAQAHADAVARDPSHPRAFPGILIYPQTSYGANWGNATPNDTLTRNQEYLADIIQYMVNNYNGDINRVYMHGLSLGARGVWDTATKRPDLFAAILPMSGISPFRPFSAEVLQTTPIWLFQGGLDSNPVPGAAQFLINDLRAYGANPTYTLYPNLGHGTWDTAYGEANFFSWMLAQDKRKIYVYGDKVWGGTVELCPGVSNTKKLGFSAGFTEYRWKKDGDIIPGATTRFYTVTGTGDYTGQYTVEFQRPGDNITWHSSFPVTIISDGGGSAFVPELTVSGSLIRPFSTDNGIRPSSVNAAETRLIAPEGYLGYQWFKDEVLEGTTTGNSVGVTYGGGTANAARNFNNKTNAVNAGNWQVSVLLPSGCWSELSNVKTLVQRINAGQDVNTTPPNPACYPCHTSPVAPGGNNGSTGDPEYRIKIRNSGNERPTVTALSESKIKITWGENGVDIVTGETHFEIWRARISDENYPYEPAESNPVLSYKMVGTAPANATEFIDEGLRPFAQYYYMVRPVTDTDGRFSRRNEPAVRTLDDTTPPSIPQDLSITAMTGTSVSISWNPSSDNDRVYAYQVYKGNTLMATLMETPPTGDPTDGNPHPPTTYTFTGLEVGDTYILNVRAVDFRGNRSDFPQALTVTMPTLVNGISFNYFFRNPMPGANGIRLSVFDFTQVPDQTDVTHNFNNAAIVGTGAGNKGWQNTTDPNNYFLDHTAYLQVNVAGNYRFYTSSDDGSRLYIDDELVVDSDFDQGTTLRNGVVTNLSVGLHKIRVQYYEVGGGNVLTVGYNYSTQTTIVPWSNATAYAVGDIALRTSNNTYYRTLQAHTDIQPAVIGGNFWTAVSPWINSTNYLTNTVVTYNDTYYRAIAGGSDNKPGENGADYWTLTNAPSTWSSSTTYPVGALVRFPANNSIYIATSESTNQTPSTGSDFWTLVVSGTGNAPNWSNSSSYTVFAVVRYPSNTNNYYRAIANNIDIKPNAIWTNFWTQVTATEWNNSTAYVTNDVVTYSGASYWATASSTDIKPGINGADYWVSIGTTAPTLPATSTSIITAIPAWANNTSYAVGDIVFRTQSGTTTYYRAIAGGSSGGTNTRQPPNTSYWESLGTTAPHVAPANNGAARIIPDDHLFRIGVPTYSNYYYVPTTDDLTLRTNWWSGYSYNQTTGEITSSGSNPLDLTLFTTNNTIYNILDSRTLNTSWTVGGANSFVKVNNVNNNGASLTLNGTTNVLTGRLSAGAGATINLNTGTINNIITSPALHQLDPASTVNISVAGTIPQVVYGNLNLTTGSTVKQLPISTTLVSGNLVISDQVTLAGSTSPAPGRSTLTVAGNITFEGNSGASPSENQRYSLVLTGNNTVHTLNVNAADVALMSLDVEGTLNLNTNDSNPHTLTVGLDNASGGLLLRDEAQLNLSYNNLVVNGLYGINPTGTTGEISINGRDITVNTNSAQTSSLNFAPASHTIRKLSLTNNNTGQINIGGEAELTNLMTVGSGTTVNMQGDFVLKSVSDAANGTARIGPLLDGARITGSITAERYMSGEGRIYRYISSPVVNATAAQLQQFFPITGNFAGTNLIPGSTASMFHYVETADPQYQQFPSMGGSNQETLQTGKGYVPFIREGIAGTVWKVTGEPHQGTVPFTLTGGTGSILDGWNLLGNPYPAPIQWTGNSTGGWTMSGVNSVIYIRENSNAIPGGFRWRSSDGLLGDPFDGTIAPGQAFWVRTITANPTLTISENAKKITDGAFYREGAPENIVGITMRSANAEDAIYIRFADGATPAFDTHIDGVKQDNSYFNLSSLTSDGKAMAINLTTPDYCAQEIPLRIANAAAGSYQLEINGVQSILSGDKVTLIDNFLGTETVIEDSHSLSFSITSDPVSKADGRFTLRFEKPNVRLDMALASETACEQSNPVIRITNAQPGVAYQAFHNNTSITQEIVAGGSTLDMPVNPTAIGYGTTVATLKAGFRGCNSFDLVQTIAVQRDTLALPEIVAQGGQLVASTENAQYVWYFEGEKLIGQNGRALQYPENGMYQVEVTLGSCTKLSEPVIFAVTSVETSLNEQNPYPNPTRNKVVVTLTRPASLSSIRTVTVVGQVIETPVLPLSEYSVEVNFSEQPAGLYLLYVNEKRYRIIKE